MGRFGFIQRPRGTFGGSLKSTKGAEFGGLGVENDLGPIVPKGGDEFLLKTRFRSVDNHRSRREPTLGVKVFKLFIRRFARPDGVADWRPNALRRLELDDFSGHDR